MMTKDRMRSWTVMLMAGVVLVLAACGCSSSPEAEEETATPTAVLEETMPPTSVPSPVPTATQVPPAPTATSTPTPVSQAAPTLTPDLAHRCRGLSGEMEVRVLVGPADAVGLEPLAIGYIPFSVVTEVEPYQLQGSGSIGYSETLVENWGTFDVSANIYLDVSGECVGDAQSAELVMDVVVTGEQHVRIESQGYQGEFPWSGEYVFHERIPAEEGATLVGEGWELVLHLD